MFADYIQNIYDKKGLLTYPEIQSAVKAWIEVAHNFKIKQNGKELGEE